MWRLADEQRSELLCVSPSSLTELSAGKGVQCKGKPALQCSHQSPAGDVAAAAHTHTSSAHAPQQLAQKGKMAQDGAFDEDWFELFGARGDGRGLDEPRRLAVQLGTARSRHVDGSCDVAQGLTRVSAHAQGPREHERRSDEKHDRCVLEVSATYAPFASVGARTGARRQDGRDLENAVRNALAPALMAERYRGRSSKSTCW